MFIDVATVQERLDNFSALQSQIEEDPANAPASAQLERAYREQGRTEGQAGPFQAGAGLDRGGS